MVVVYCFKFYIDLNHQLKAGSYYLLYSRDIKPFIGMVLRAKSDPPGKARYSLYLSMSEKLYVGFFVQVKVFVLLLFYVAFNFFSELRTVREQLFVSLELSIFLLMYVSCSTLSMFQFTQLLYKVVPIFILSQLPNIFDYNGNIAVNIQSFFITMEITFQP